MAPKVQCGRTADRRPRGSRGRRAVRASAGVDGWCAPVDEEQRSGAQFLDHVVRVRLAQRGHPRCMIAQDVGGHAAEPEHDERAEYRFLHDADQRLDAASQHPPDVPPVTIGTWARLAPADFLATAASELDGTSETATYGPPYNNQTASAQRLLLSPATIAGVRQPVNAAQDFVIGPLATLARTDPGIAAPLATYRAATTAQQLKWATAYGNAVTKVTFAGGRPVIPAAGDGPVPALMAGELALARSGALDTDLLSQQPFYGTNFTKPLLFIEDGAYFVSKATALGLTGSQWGVMNAIIMTGLATILLLLVPLIPGLRDIPRLIPVHKLIWRHWDTPGPRPAEDSNPVPGPTAGTSLASTKSATRHSGHDAPARAAGE